MAIQLNPSALAEAMKLVFADCDNGPALGQPPADFIFVHGSPTNNDVLDDKVLAVAADIYHRGEAKAVMINGLIVEGEARLAYPGANVWIPKLEALGVKDILQIPPSLNTAIEAEAVTVYANEMNAKNVLVASQRHHQPRVMASWSWYLKQIDSKLRVYARSFKDVDWQMLVRKVVLNGGIEEGTLLDLFAGEVIRIGVYADPLCFDPATGKKKYTPNSTPEELVAYYKWRDAP